MKVLTDKDLESIILGSTFLGAGGGGSAKEGKHLKGKRDEVGRQSKIESLENIDDDAIVAVCGGMGSPIVALKEGLDVQLIYAIDALEEYLGKKIDYIIPFEVGGGNTMGPIYVATTKDIPILDADGAGRAVPELQMTMYAIEGVPFDPFIISNKKGTTAILKVSDTIECENLARAITTEFGMNAGFATNVMSGKKVKDIAIKGTINLAKKIGNILLKDDIKIEKKVEEILKVIDGHKLIGGKVAKVKTVTEKGFDFSQVLIDGIGDSKGKKLIIDVKNENMIAWDQNKKPVAMIPDLICTLDKNGNPITNADIKEELEVIVFGIKSDKKWRRPIAYNIFRENLRRFGFDSTYIPIEKLIV